MEVSADTGRIEMGRLQTAQFTEYPPAEKASSGIDRTVLHPEQTKWQRGGEQGLSSVSFSIKGTEPGESLSQIPAG
jgi:hypothetical protein